MSVSREHYNEIMRVIADRHYMAVKQQNRRKNEVYEAVPAMEKLDGELSRLRSEEAAARLRKNTEKTQKLKAERRIITNKKNELLKSAGYPEDYLNIRYHCSLCGDTGYVGNEKCGCFKQLESEMLNRESGLPALMEKENFSTFKMSVFDKSTPIEELYPKRITQYDYMKSRVLADVKKYLLCFEENGNGNILMFGPAGTGKTFLCNCIAKALIEKQHSVIYERAGELFGRLTRSEFSKKRSEEDEALDERLKNCDLLIIDDLGTEFSTEYTRSRLYSIISDRLSYGLSTIISTNMSMSQIRSDYGERISSRFMGQYMLIPFYGADIRVAGNKGE